MLHINIGLRIDALGDTEANEQDAMNGRAWMARQALKHWGRITRWGISQSSTEQTLVVEVDVNGTVNAETIEGLANALGQEAIAAYDPDSGHGLLAGHNAKAWGEFNPAYFISPYGLEEHEIGLEVEA